VYPVTDMMPRPFRKRVCPWKAFKVT